MSVSPQPCRLFRPQTLNGLYLNSTVSRSISGQSPPPPPPRERERDISSERGSECLSGEEGTTLSGEDGQNKTDKRKGNVCVCASMQSALQRRTDDYSAYSLLP